MWLSPCLKNDMRTFKFKSIFFFSFIFYSGIVKSIHTSLARYDFSNCCSRHLQSVCLSNVLATLTDTVSQPPVHNSTVMDYTPAATETAGTLSRHTAHAGNTQRLSIIQKRGPGERETLHSQETQPGCGSGIKKT